MLLRRIFTTLLVALFAVNPALAAGIPCAAWAELAVSSCCCAAPVDAPAPRSCCEEEPASVPSEEREQAARDASRCGCRAAPTDDSRTARTPSVRTDSPDAHRIEIGARISARTPAPFETAGGAALFARTLAPPGPIPLASPPAAGCTSFRSGAHGDDSLLTSIRIALL